MTRVKSYELREKDQKMLLKELSEQKKQLLEARTSKASGAKDDKLSQLRTIRHNIARILTIISEKKRDFARAQFKGAKFLPKDLRSKKTRAVRQREFLEANLTKQSLRQKKRAIAFPQRTYFVEM